MAESHVMSRPMGDHEEFRRTSLLPPYGIREVASGDIVLLIGEPGMGKTTMARRLMHTSSGDAHVECCYFQHVAHDVVVRVSGIAQTLTSSARRDKEKHTIVLLDDFPSVGEEALPLIVRSLRVMAVRGCALIVTLRPEAEQLADELPEAHIVRAPDLIFRMPINADESCTRIWQLTRGIPCLVEACSDDGGSWSFRYVEALQGLIRQSLRSGLPRFERQLRFAMMLLGAGSFADLREMVAGADAETLAWLSRECPLFGIDLLGMSFACAGIAEDELARACYSALRDVDDSFTSVIERAYEELVSRTRYIRAAICCALMPAGERRSRLVMNKGVELCLSGGSAIVRDSVSVARKLCMQEEPGYNESSIALAVLEDSARHLDQLCPSQIASAGGETCTQLTGEVYAPLALQQATTHLSLMVASRHISMGRQEAVDLPFVADELSESMLEHIEARQLIASGSCSAAVERLSDVSLQRKPITLPEVLLLNDVLIAGMLCSQGMPAQSYELLEAAREALTASQLHRLMVYERAMPDVLRVLSGGIGSTKLDQAVAYAERSGDEALHAALLLVLFLSDVRSGGFATARVRSARAAHVARRTQFSFIASCTGLFEAVMGVMLGEEGLLRQYVQADRREGIPRDLGRVLLAMGCDAAVSPVSPAEDAMRRTDGAQGIDGAVWQQMDVLERAHLVSDAVWLVRVLAYDFGSISTLFRRRMPPSWRYAVSGEASTATGVATLQMSTLQTVPSSSSGSPSTSLQALGRRAPGIQGGASEDGQAVPATRAAVPAARVVTAATSTARVSLALLGNFTVMVDGHVIAPDRLGRRRARTLLALLAAKDGHIMRRLELIGAIWPDEPIDTGMQRLYEAISGARKVLGAKILGFEPFVINKANGTVGLNGEIVVCDIDLFEATAAACAHHDGLDGEVIRYACEARDLYAGDLECSVLGVPPWAQHRAELLRSTYVDTMVAGARAALRSGKEQLAVRLAKSAAVSERDREDVIAVYLESLCAIGRIAEAREVYSRYCARLVSREGLPPTKQLRHLASELLSEGAASSKTLAIVDEEFSGATDDSVS